MRQETGAGRRPQDIDGSYSWLRLALCLALSTIGSSGMWAVVVVLPAVQAEFGIDRADASLPFAFTMAGFAFGNLMIGRVADRVGIMLPVLAATVALFAGFLLSAMAGGIWTFALAHAVIGFGCSATFGPLMTDISHWFRLRRGIAVATAASGNYFAGVIWPLAMQGYLVTEGWRVTYAGIGVIVLVTMLPLALLLRRPAPSLAHVDGPDGIAHVGAARLIDVSPRTLQLMLIVAGLGCCVAMAMPQVHIVAYCVDLGYGVARGSEMLSLMLAGGIVSRLASGFLADRIGGVKTLLLGSVLQALSLLFYIPFDGLTPLYIVSFMFGLAQGGIVPSYAIIVREYLPAAEAGRRVGIVIMATILGMALGGWLSGYIYDLTGSYAAAFLNGIAWNMLNIAVLLLLLWRTRMTRTAAA